MSESNEVMESPTIGALAGALAKAQGAMRAAPKDSNNPFFNSKYADLASVWSVIREPLSANGLAVSQRLSTGEKGVVITTELMHASGEWIRDRLFVPVTQSVSKDGKQQAWIQAFGSAVTYARRYALSSIVGVAADEDDDGNSAGTTSPGPIINRPQVSARTTTDAVREKLAAKLGTTQTKVVPVDSEPPPNMEEPQAEDTSAVITFTKHKGKRLSQVDMKSLEWFLERAQEKAADASDKWHRKNVEWLAAVKTEMDRRTGEVPMSGEAF